MLSKRFTVRKSTSNTSFVSVKEFICITIVLIPIIGSIVPRKDEPFRWHEFGLSIKFHNRHIFISIYEIFISSSQKQLNFMQIVIVTSFFSRNMLILLLASVCFSGLSPEEKEYYSSLPDAAYIYYLGEVSDEYISYYEEAKNRIINCDFTQDDYDDPEEFEWGMDWCRTVKTKIKSFIFSTNGNLNSKLGEVSNDVDYLFIRFAEPPPEKIDFTKLKTKKNVGVYTSLSLAKTLSGKDILRSILMSQHEQFIKHSDTTPANIKRLIKHDQKANRKAKEGYGFNLKISGSMKDKVGFLTFYGGYDWTVTFVDSKCDCQCLYFRDSVSEAENSKGIACDILYLFGSYFDKVQLSKLEVKQFSVYTYFRSISDSKCVLEYGQDSLNAYVSNKDEPEFSIPYSYSTESFGLVLESFKDDLIIEIKKGDNVPTDKALHALNLSLFVEIYENNPIVQEGGPARAKITQSGWGESDPKPQIVLTYNSDNVEVDKTSIDNFDVSVEKPQPRPDSSQSEPKDGLSPGAIAGIVIACIVVVAAIVAVVVYFVFFRNKGHDSSKEGEK